MYTFRIRLQLAKRFTGLDLGGRRFDLPSRPGIAEHVRLETWSPNELFRDATSLLLIGDGYETPQHAHRASRAWRDQLQVVLAHAKIGADFGDRHDRQISKNGRTYWNEMPLNGVVNYAEHGLVVYPTERGPHHWMHAEVLGVTGIAFAPSTEILDIVSENQIFLNDQGQVAFNLYSASFGVSNADARLLMVTGALETLAPRELRDEAEVGLLAQLITIVNEAGAIEHLNREALRGGLSALRNKSISQRLRSLWPLLDGQSYGGKTAEKAFRNAYRIRNKIVHDPTEGVPPHDVAVAAFDLQNIVADLLANAVRVHISERRSIEDR